MGTARELHPALLHEVLLHLPARYTRLDVGIVDECLLNRGA
jgi:hypothetical protein